MLPRLLFLLTGVLVATSASPALAAVPIGDDGVLRPRDGAELLEAAGLATTAAPGRANPVARIELGPATYRVDRAVVLGDAAGDTLVGDESGRSRITGTGPATTLLRLSGEQTRASNVSVEASGAGTYPAVQLTSGATLSGAVLSVPEELPGVTAVETTGHATILTTEIESGATAATIVAHGSIDLLRGTSVTGGDPALDLRGAAADATSTIDRGFLRAAPGAKAIVRARAGSATTRLRIQSSTLRASDDGTTLIDLRGASASTGRLALDLAPTTLAGAPDTTAVRLTQGAERTPTTATLTGLLALGSATTVACDGTGTARPTVRIAGIWRAGSLPTSGCAVDESGRVTGDVALATPYGPTFAPNWNSPLVDAIPEPSGVETDQVGAARVSTGPRTPAATPADIGAIEYAYVAPAVEELTVTPVGTDGTVQFSVAPPAYDPELGPEAANEVAFSWIFPDGSSATGTEVTRRFTSASPGDVRVTATHVNGMTTTEAAPIVIPGFVTGDPSGGVDREPSAQGPIDRTPETPAPTPPSTNPLTPAPAAIAPGVQQVLPDRMSLPRPTPGVQTPLSETVGVVASLRRTGRAISPRAARASGLGAARAGEAAIAITLRRAASLTVIVRRRQAGRLLTVPNARLTAKAPSGTETLHLSTRVGQAALRAGLYRVTIIVRPPSGPAERQDLYVRVLRSSVSP